MKDFSTPERRVEVIPFTLDGVEFQFTPPKRAELIKSVVSSVGLDRNSTESDSVKDLLNWLGEGLPDDQSSIILDRLQDPNDDFDLAQVNEIARYLLGQTSNRPTRRRSGS